MNANCRPLRRGLSASIGTASFRIAAIGIAFCGFAANVSPNVVLADAAAVNDFEGGVIDRTSQGGQGEIGQSGALRQP